MRFSQRVRIAAAIIAVSLITARTGVAQPPVPSTNAGHQIDRSTKDYDVSAEIVFKALEQYYRSAGIKPTTLNSAAYQISYVASPAGPKVGSSKIENVVDCGGGKKTPLARTTPLSISVRSEIVPRGGSATLKTVVDAVPIAGANDSLPLPSCVSTFMLERRLQPEIKLAFRVVRQH